MPSSPDETMLLKDVPPRHQWRMLWLHGDPHRFAFTCGAAMLTLFALWWTATLLGSLAGLNLRVGLLPAQTHGLVMTFAFMPLFFAGFLANAGAKWLGHPPIAASRLIPGVTLQLAGWLVLLFAACQANPRRAAAVGGLGLLIATTGWTDLWLRFATLVRTSTRRDRVHAALIVAAGGVGVCAMLAASIAVSTSDAPLQRAAVQIALWMFEGCTFAAAAHRMIPFLGGSVFPPLETRRPRWLLEFVAVLFVLEGTAASLEALAYSLPEPVQWIRIALEGMAGSVLLGVSIRWSFVQNLRTRLLAMLRVGVTWLSVAFVMFGLSHTMSLLTHGQASLGMAPLHAYTMGFLGSTMLTMVTRFVCGQAGRAVVADDFLWWVFWLLQLTVVGRLGGAVMASFSVHGAATTIALAALGWALVSMLWMWRYVPWLARPRLDRARSDVEMASRPLRKPARSHGR